MEMQSIDLEQLVLIGRQQGFLTYEQVNHYLPDEANTAEKLDQLLVALERAGVGIVDEADTDLPPHLKIFNGEESMPAAPAEMPKLTNDPIRLYLSQMCEIPLLNRDQEIALAKKIEITRRKFRRVVELFFLEGLDLDAALSLVVLTTQSLAQRMQSLICCHR